MSDILNEEQGRLRTWVDFFKLLELCELHGIAKSCIGLRELPLVGLICFGSIGLRELCKFFICIDALAEILSDFCDTVMLG